MTRRTYSYVQKARNTMDAKYAAAMDIRTKLEAHKHDNGAKKTQKSVARNTLEDSISMLHMSTSCMSRPSSWRLQQELLAANRFHQ